MTVRTVLQRTDPPLVWLDVVQPDARRSWRRSPDATGSTPPSVKDCLDPEHLPKYEQFETHVFIIVRAFDEQSRAELLHGAGADPQGRDLLRARRS